MRNQPIPIENDARTWNVRCNREMVFDHKRTRRILIDRKAMDLEPAGVCLSGHQADMQLLNAVAAYGNAVSAGKFSDL